MTLKRALAYLSLIVTLFCAGPGYANKDEVVCDRLVVKNSPGLGLTQSELALICSNPQIEAWSHITDTQALFYLKTFLEKRGYHNAKSERVGDKVVVTLGEPARVTSFVVDDAPENFGQRKMRRVVGEVLTPQLLNRVEERLLQRMQSQGFACPSQKLLADPATGEVRATLAPGQRGTVTAVYPEKVSGLNEEVLRRYDAFLLNHPFNGDWLRVTENRVVGEGLLQNTHFSPYCEGDKVTLRQKNVSGPPRLFAFGVGVNTERGPSLRASWKHVRFGETGSNVEFASSASFRLQDFTIKPKWYFLSYPSRYYFNPQLTIKHEDEKFFERYTGTLLLTPGRTWDNQDWGLTATLGPALNAQRVARGPGAKSTEFLSFNASVRMETHGHEFYRSSPQTGAAVELVGSVTEEAVLSNVTAQTARLSFEYLYNLLNYEPALVVFGLRGTLAATFVDPAAIGKLPQNYKYFLGGSADMRGFGRNSLPGPQGALTSAFLSAEIRLPDTLPWGFQPLVLFDIGAMGTKSLTLDPGYFYNPGFGLRWESPIGVLRGTLARGFSTLGPGDKRAGWTLYLSYGEEF